MPHGVFYSADLTAATEYISHEDARTIMNAIAEALGWDEGKRDASLVLLGPQLLWEPNKDWTKTKQGVLLGLGISWTILSILNAFNADPSDLKDTSFKVCGDDLLAHWDTERINQYQKRSDNAGLVINKGKSFISQQAGVFCERMERRGSNEHTTAIDVVGIREASAAKLFRRGGRSGLFSVRENLTARAQNAKGPIRKLILTTLRRTHAQGALQGPAWVGGDGGRIVTRRDARSAACLLVASWVKGPVNLAAGVGDVRWSELRRSLQDNLRPANSVTRLSEVLSTARVALVRQNLSIPISRPKEKSPKLLRAQSAGRESMGKAWRQNMHLLYGALLDSRMTSAGKRKLHYFLPTLLSKNPSPAKIRQALRETKPHWVDPLVDPEDAALLLMDSGLSPAELQDGRLRPWGFLLRELHLRQEKSRRTSPQVGDLRDQV